MFGTGSDSSGGGSPVEVSRGGTSGTSGSTCRSSQWAHNSTAMSVTRIQLELWRRA